ncbi:PspA/IM30 family protein [Paenibacillus sinopodophylli]|uniref:PspA/IM30 family protein n=1 Tax=Paenibacillus sinopodophylli TaxID=1837342 RepID=UPI001485D4B0|nr:PspA/IM30 family protein [Paenibacillus sinopodophylli]
MGILQRIANMTKAAANEMLDKIENPVLMLNHYLRDLDEEIAKAEHEKLKQQAQVRFLQAKQSELGEQASYYESKAEQAAIEEREAEARTALEAKLLYSEQTEETQKLLQLANQAALDLELHIEALKEEKTRLQEKRQDLVARLQKTASTSGSPASIYQGSSASQGFDRIEQKLMEQEAQQELARGRYGPDVRGANSNQQDLLRSSRVDEELSSLLKKTSGN